jgi:hypothetical protein
MVSTRRTKVKRPRRKTVGSTTRANTRNASPVAEIWATKTSEAESEPRWRPERAELSTIVEARAPWSVKCTVVSVVRALAGRPRVPQPRLRRLRAQPSLDRRQP